MLDSPKFYEISYSPPSNFSRQRQELCANLMMSLVARRSFSVGGHDAPTKKIGGGCHETSAVAAGQVWSSVVASHACFKVVQQRTYIMKICMFKNNASQLYGLTRKNYS